MIEIDKSSSWWIIPILGDDHSEIEQDSQYETSLLQALPWSFSAPFTTLFVPSPLQSEVSCSSEEFVFSALASRKDDNRVR
jgi:hypothetical protein